MWRPVENRFSKGFLGSLEMELGGAKAFDLGAVEWL
jgi:hypothetical protein